MTCIVSYKTKNKVYMGADSIGSNGHQKGERKDSKLFKKGEMLIGYTSSFRMGQLLKWKLKLPEHPKKMSIEEYMNTLFIDEVINCFTVNGFTQIKENTKSGGTFLVAYKGRVFCIHDDFQVGEDSSCISACGSGEDTAKGAMAALLKYDKKINPKKLLQIALEITSQKIVSVGGPFKFMEV